MYHPSLYVNEPFKYTGVIISTQIVITNRLPSGGDAFSTKLETPTQGKPTHQFVQFTGKSSSPPFSHPKPTPTTLEAATIQSNYGMISPKTEKSIFVICSAARSVALTRT